VVVASMTQGVARKASLALGCWNYTFGIKDQISKPDQTKPNWK
jgi:hypothetical protein